jgi:hypothetical protein
MDDQHDMIPMGGEDEIEGTDAPPTVKERNAAQQAVNRLLDALAPERAANRIGAKQAEVDRFRTPRGCILQALTGAVTVSWFPDSAQGAELGELQVMSWRGTVSRPGSSMRATGAQMIDELVARPIENRTGELVWRAENGDTYSTDALAKHCLDLLEQWTGSPVQ